MKIKANDYLCINMRELDDMIRLLENDVYQARLVNANSVLWHSESKLIMLYTIKRNGFSAAWLASRCYDEGRLLANETADPETLKKQFLDSEIDGI